MGTVAVSMLFALIAGCAPPMSVDVGGARQGPRLGGDHAVMADGARLPLKRWPVEPPAGMPETVLLALHGFNNYSNAFAKLGDDLAAVGVTVYAVDQRGFGEAPLPGRWHGVAQMAEDLRTLVALLRARHPAARLLVAGESMGGAVIMVAAARGWLPADGLVLIAPAVWARETMPWYQRLALGWTARVWPGLLLTGEGIERWPSDNVPMLRAMGRDPLVIKATRVDALWGVTNLMDQALAAAPRLPAMPTLLLYGERDEIIPRRAYCRLLRDLPRRPSLRLALYLNGWHMLPRDLQGARVRSDITAWARDPTAALPSGEETALDGGRLRAFCAGD
jgi:alpha-beta hydrolase superfamily lysophospholipase